MRLGEILVAAGLLTPQQLSEALVRQSTSAPERLGTHVVHLGYATPDQVAQALAKQHGVPPALVRHFVHHDPKVADLIGPKVAATHSLLPIAFSRAGGRRLVICCRDPHQPALIAKIEKALGIPVTVCVASELAIGIYLDHYYGVQPSFSPAKAPRAESEDGIDIDVDDLDEEESGLDTLQLIELDKRDPAYAQPAEFVPEAERRSAIRLAVAAAQVSSAGIDALDLITESPPKPPVPTPPPTDVPVSADSPGPAESDEDEAWFELPEVLAAIDQGEKRSEVIESIMQFLRQRFAGGMMFTIKDGLAMGHRGFGGHLDDKDTVTALMLPLQNNILSAAHDSMGLWRGDPGELSSAAQDRFLKLFALPRPPSDVVVVPVTVGPRVACLLYAHAHQGIEIDDSDVEDLAEVAEATTRAFSRLITKSRAATSA